MKVEGKPGHYINSFLSETTGTYKLPHSYNYQLSRRLNSIRQLVTSISEEILQMLSLSPHLQKSL